MATRHFDNLGTLPVPSSTLLMSGYAAPLRLSLPQAPGSDLCDPQRTPAEVDWSSMGRCLRWAFTIEGGAALAAYALWQLWRLWA